MTTGTAAAPRLLTGRTVLFLLAAVSAATSFYVLLTVVPLYVTRSGAQAAGAGLATAVLMLTTVVAELAAPRVIARLGRRSRSASPCSDRPH